MVLMPCTHVHLKGPAFPCSTMSQQLPKFRVQFGATTLSCSAIAGGITNSNCILVVELPLTACSVKWLACGHAETGCATILIAEGTKCSVYHVAYPIGRWEKWHCSLLKRLGQGSFLGIRRLAWVHRNCSERTAVRPSRPVAGLGSEWSVWISGTVVAASAQR